MWLLITAIDISTPDRRFILDADTNRTLDRCKCFLPGSQYAFPICRFSLTQAWLNSKRDGGRSLLDKNYVRLSDILKPRAACRPGRSEEHTSELQSLMRISYAVFCLKKKKRNSTVEQIDKT